MRQSLRTSAQAMVVAASSAALLLTVGAGVSSAAPEDCVVTHDLFTASASCHDTDAPPGREYTVIIDCVGIRIGDLLPPIVIGLYGGMWGGSFAPNGGGSSSCISGGSVGIATGAHVAIYRNP